MNAGGNEFPPITELLPHRGSLLLLERVLAADADSLSAETRVPASGWMLDSEGAMPAWLGIELMAQAIAAHASLMARKKNAAPKKGVLLGSRAFKSALPRFAPGSVLRIFVKLIFRDESGLGAYDCGISTRDGDVVSATLKVFEPADFDAFIREHRQ